ncbi:Uncharacterised protein [uncultured archaeon]|nr:Uncharacterised protein [uncultured archaeon]
MKIDPRNFNITPESVSELEANYDTRVVLEDYFIDYTVYNGPINKRFFTTFLYRLKKSVDRDEIWKKRYLGKDVDSWEHLEQKLYRGPDPPEYAQPHELHWKIDIYFRPRKKKLTEREFVAQPLGLLSKILASLIAVITLDTFFPAKDGESNVGRNALGAFVFVEYLNAKHEEDQRREAQE